MPTFGEVVRKARLEAEMTLSEFCAAVDDWDKSNWSKIERNMTMPPTDEATLRKIFNLLRDRGLGVGDLSLGQLACLALTAKLIMGGTVSAVDLDFATGNGAFCHGPDAPPWGIETLVRLMHVLQVSAQIMVQPTTLAKPKAKAKCV